MLDLKRTPPRNKLSRIVLGLGRLRLQAMEAGPVLRQILALRARAWSGEISLAPDLLRWGDALDTRAQHWCLFNDVELIASGRMSVHAAFDDIADRDLFQPLRASLRYPVASMTHAVVHPRFRGLHLEKALDAARIERAHQLRCPMILAIADGEHAIALRQTGFTVLGPTAGAACDGRRALVLDLLADGHPGETSPRP